MDQPILQQVESQNKLQGAIYVNGRSGRESRVRINLAPVPRATADQNENHYRMKPPKHQAAEPVQRASPRIRRGLFPVFAILL